MIQIRLGNDLLDLYPDENIRITRTVQDVTDISATLTDFSESFSLPATPNNNRFFRHWYNVDITNGFDARVRHNASIDINYAPFINGVIQLNNVVISNGSIEDYNVTFFGSGVQLNDLFGEDLLTELDLSSDAIPWNDGFVSNLISGQIAPFFRVTVPLISTTRNWTYGLQNGVLLPTNIAYRTTPNLSGMDLDELRPSISLTRIFEAIENKYGITFNSTFMQLESFTRLYMYANAQEGHLRSYSLQNEVNVVDSEDFTPWNKQVSVTAPQNSIGTWKVEIECAFVPDTGFDANVVIIINDGTDEFRFEGQNNNAVGRYTLEYDNAPETKTLSIKIACDRYVEGEFRVGETQFAKTPWPVEKFTLYVDSDFTSIPVVRFTNQDGYQGHLPKMKVTDFLTSLINCFNLTITSDSPNVYTMETLDTWYAQGNRIDLTRYLDTQNVTQMAGVTYNEIEYLHDPTGDAITNQGFENANSKVYGNLISKFNFNGGTLSIQSEFDNILLTRLNNGNENELSPLLVGNYIDEELEPVETNPIIHYLSGLRSLNTNERISIKGSANTPIAQYNVISQERINLTTNAVIESLNFGSEISTWNLSETQESLFSNFWNSYISGVLSVRSRLFIFEGVVPLHIINNIKLNDTILIRDVRYRINVFKPNLLTGECQFELINVI